MSLTVADIDMLIASLDPNEELFIAVLRLGRKAQVYRDAFKVSMSGKPVPKGNAEVVMRAHDAILSDDEDAYCIVCKRQVDDTHYHDDECPVAQAERATR